MNKLNVHCFQHVAVEGLGCIADWIETKGYNLSYTTFYDNPVLPSIDDFDCLVVMGGPMGVYDDAEYPWLLDERRMIKEAVEADKVVLGVCLGAQFIAAALGAKVYPGDNIEIGWFEIQSAAVENVNLLSALDGQRVFHWHGDTFDLPEGAVCLASSEATPHQAFMYKRALALQFHLEVNEKSVAGMVEEFSDHLCPSRFVQSADEILSQMDVVKNNNEAMFAVLEALIEK